MPMCPDDGQRYAVVGWKQWSELLTIQEFANAQYVGDDRAALAGTQAKRWLGATWIPHSGLTKNGALRYCYLYHKTAVGHAAAAEISTDITWHGDRAAHFVQHDDEPGRGADRRRRRHQAALPGGVSMAYLSKDLSALGYANGFTLWHYRTSRPRRRGRQCRLFQRRQPHGPRRRLHPAQCRPRSEPTHGVVVVVANAGGVVDVTNVTTFGAVNTD